MLPHVLMDLLVCLLTLLEKFDSLQKLLIVKLGPWILAPRDCWLRTEWVSRRSCGWVSEIVFFRFRERVIIIFFVKWWVLRLRWGGLCLK
jgi:hypothetical protein